MSDSPPLPQPPINLKRGWPSPSLHPTTFLLRATSTVLSTPTLSSPGLSYAPGEGHMSLRTALASYLGAFYDEKSPPDPLRLCITGGASQNLAGILEVYTDPVFTQRVWMVTPCYFLACRMFVDAGLGSGLRAVPEDDEGVDVEFLRSRLEKMPKSNLQPLKPLRPYAKLYRNIIYCVPTFSNPSGKTMSLRRRTQLVELARQHDALIISDDVYDLLQWRSSPSPSPSPSNTVPTNLPHSSLKTALLPRLTDLDLTLPSSSTTSASSSSPFGNTVSNGSFSKIIAPGCRSGWAHGTRAFVHGLSQLGSTHSGGSASGVMGPVIAEMLASGDLSQHIEGLLKPAYERRWRIMMLAVQRELVPLGVRVGVGVGMDLDLPGRGAKVKEEEEEEEEEEEGKKKAGAVVGGYFIWLTLPDGLQAEDVVREAAEKENLILGAGEEFAVLGDEGSVDLSGCLRICFAFEEEEFLKEGVKRLGRVVEAMLGKGVR